MKILYGIQGTGNGHISAAQELIPHLSRYGEVDVVLSGTQCEVELGHPVKYRLNGLGFVFGKRGGIDYLKTFRSNKLKQVFMDVQSLPVDEYDIVITDFEPVTAWACRLQQKSCLSIGHQPAVLHPEAPQPRQQDNLGKAVLKYYAPARQSLAFHYLPYAPGISTALIRQELRRLPVTEGGHYTVYLPAFGDKQIIRLLSLLPQVKWQVFSKHCNRAYSAADNISIEPIQNNTFLQSLASASAVLCGAGFQTTAEALFLKKKLMVVPMKGQLEQQCNAAALAALGVQVIKNLKKRRAAELARWISTDQHIDLYFPDHAAEIARLIISHPLWQKGVQDRKEKKVKYKKFRRQLADKIFNTR